MADHATLFEVGPRDGLQSMPGTIPTAGKVALIRSLARAGLRRIEVASFVNPARVPQMADGSEVMAALRADPAFGPAGPRLAALTPNLRGLNAARDAACDEVAIFASASEGFSHANLGCSIAESFDRFAPVMGAARAAGLPVRGYLSAIFHCPYDGEVAPEQVAAQTRRLLDMGCYAVSLGDTIGAGNGVALDALLDAVLDQCAPEVLAGHFHDTHGAATEMVRRGLERGLRVFDGSVAGLGGCPFAPGAPGNVDTRRVLETMTEMGLSHGVDLTALAEAETRARTLVAQVRTASAV